MDPAKRSVLEGRRKLLRYLAFSPLLANPALIAFGSNKFYPQPVKSLRPVEDHVRPTIQQLSRQIRDRSISPVELTRDCLARIDQLNPTLNAFITVTANSALDQARRAEQEILRGEWRGPLHGIPIGLKDILDTAGVRTTAASALYKDRIPAEDAEVVRRLRAAGAIILGKQNLHEFAYGGSSMISLFGEVHNPWDITRVTGGSSGGSAASVAAGLGFAAVGTDTAGSVRLPAAYCGVVGLKPTYGRVSARGVVPLSWSYDHVGPIVNSVYDSALMLQVLAGYDPADPASIDRPVPDFVAAIAQSIAHPAPKLRIGVPRAFFFDDLHPEVAGAIEKAIELFRELHAEIREVKLEVSTDRKLASAEAYAYHESFVASSPELYQPATLARIQSGAKVSASDALRASRDLQASRHAIRKMFDDVDVLLTPTVPLPPAVIADLREHPDNLRPQELIMLRNTRPFNVWGIPAISVPCGFTKDDLPIGLQLAAAPWREDVVLQAAHAYEQATEWHKKMPEPLRTT
ncbi:MAG: amidase [Terriglobales bacterium]|jgi:aspartyl-tRNA(Asn)/glutamyl-tRNA(Gln) amidotransferase subunit A